MTDSGQQTKTTRIMMLPLLLVCAAITLSCNAGREAAETEQLRQERRRLLSRIETLREEHRFLRFEKELTGTDKRYLVLDTQKGVGSLRLGGRVLREFNLFLNECMRPEPTTPEDASSYVLPKGSVQIIALMKDPVWYVPDWFYLKEGKAPPPVNGSERLIRGPMGAYAIFFGGGFVIHGRPLQGAPRAPMQHACIILKDDDLRVVVSLLDKGSVAYVR